MNNLVEFYDRVFNLLVSIGGASEAIREDFVYHHARSDTPCDEYRFQGKLGFGGKYWRAGNRVTCYSEDENKGRLEIIRRLNEELSKLPSPPNIV